MDLTRSPADGLRIRSRKSCIETSVLFSIVDHRIRRRTIDVNQKNLFISDDDLTKKLEQRSIDKVEFCFADYDKTKNDSRFMKLVDVVRC